MRVKWILASLLIMFLLAFSITSSAQIDRSKTGLEEDFSFVYKITDTFPSGENTPRLFYVNVDGESKYIPNGNTVTISIEQVPSQTSNILFEIKTDQGSQIFQDDASKYGQPFVYTDWSYWSATITEDFEVISEPGVNETTTIINTTSLFGSNHTGVSNTTAGSFWVYNEFNFDFLYNKETGATENTYFSVYTEYDNGSSVLYEYGYELISQDLDTSDEFSFDLTLIANIIFYGLIIGGVIFLIRKFQTKGDSKPTGNTSKISQKQSTMETQTNNQKPNFCTKCGNPLKAKYKFCMKCGNEI